ncbi:MAG: ABC transporter permease [Kordiimonadaceae bacterium]|nr:ABC transporter permease [Kordiimonadaceae bacterium]MBO6569684.1 ABC transporter permease [Kordiimonadaceae bacterium]MBO6966219.1 ABC transporter permease [Kordiimonadaceae bacterium]
MFFGLAIAFTFMTAITQYVRHELSYDTFWHEAERVYRIQATITYPGQEPTAFATSNHPLRNLLKSNFSEVEAVSRLLNTKATFHRDGVMFDGIVSKVDPEFLDIFDFAIIDGIGKAGLADPRGIMISETLAQRLFGEEQAIGKVIPVSLYDQGLDADFRVTGVFQDVPHNSHLAIEAIVQFDESLHRAEILSNWRAALIFTYAKLTRGANPISILNRLPELERQVIPPSGSWDVAESLVNTLNRVDQLHLFQSGVDDMKPGGNLQILYIYALSGLLLVVISGANFVNTMVVQAQFRIKEVALRKVFGAGLPQIQRQFLPESLLISFGAFYLSIIGFEVWGDQIFDLIGYQGGRNGGDLSMSGLFVALTAFALALFAGLFPATRLAAKTPIDSLRTRNAAYGVSMRFSRMMMSFQFIIAATLLIVGSVVWAQVQFIQSKDLGYEPDNVILLNSLPSDAGKSSDLFSKLSDLPGVVASARGMSAPTEGTLPTAGFSTPGHDLNAEYIFPVQFMNPDFFDVFDYELLAGRRLSFEYGEDHYSSERGFNMLVNEALIEKLGFGSPQQALGQQLWWGQSDDRRFITIVGVVENIHQTSLRDEIEPMMFWIREDFYFSYAFRTAGRSVDEVFADMERVWRETVPDRVFVGELLEDRLMKQYGPEMKLLDFLQVAGVLSLVISCMGLYAVSSFLLAKQRKEFAIRRVLGASVLQAWKLAATRAIKPVFWALVVAFPAAYIFVTEWLNGFAYRIDVPFGLFGAAAILVIAVAVFSINAVAYQVSRVSMAALLADE